MNLPPFTEKSRKDTSDLSKSCPAPIRKGKRLTKNPLRKYMRNRRAMMLNIKPKDVVKKKGRKTATVLSMKD